MQRVDEVKIGIDALGALIARKLYDLTFDHCCSCIVLYQRWSLPGAYLKRAWSEDLRGAQSPILFLPLISL